jgi:Putative metal-binding domain of cation transport ATPase
VVTVKYNKNCSLCGLPVEIEGFSLVTEKGVQSFCCAGCQSIYQLVHLNKNIIENDSTKLLNNEEND